MVFELLENELDQLVRVLPKSGVLLLSGVQAGGKTTLVKAIIRAPGMAEGVPWPPFSLMQFYGKEIYPYAFYRIGFDGMPKMAFLKIYLKMGFIW